LKQNLSKIILTIVLIGLSIYALYPTYKDYTLQQELSKLTGQDSINFIDANGQELKDAEEERIKLGLDLKGGMYVVLDVDVMKLLNDLAVRKDQQLEQVLEEMKNSNLDSDEPLVDVLKQKLDSRGLSLKSYYGEIRDTEEEIEGRLNQEIDGAIERAVEVVRNRVDQYGVSEPQIQKVGGNRIIVELPGVSNPEDVRQLLQGTALLEFKLVYDPQKTVEVMQKVNALLASDTSLNKDGTNVNPLSDIKTNDSSKSLLTDTITDKQNTTAGKNDTTDKKQDTKTTTSKDTTKKTTDTTKNKDTSKTTDTSGSSDTGQTQDTNQMTQEEFEKENPLFFTLVQIDPESGQADGYVSDLDKAKVDRLLARPDVKALIPSDMQFLWSNRTQTGENGILFHTLIAVKKTPELTGKSIVDALATIDQTSNTPVVNMSMDSEGSGDWARITGANIDKRIAIVLDNVVYSAPVVRNKITGGSSVIEGMASVEEANLLAIVLKAGALPAPLKIIEERTIGPSLGEDSINAGVTSSIAALILVALFMIAYYRSGGAVADFALLINVLFVLGIMATFKATLTLPGIAGFILSLGMAVDTNVLIFERIREEMAIGKPMKTAVEIGFKKAFSAIFDSHITTVITGVILYQFGTGPIQGFAITLLFGVTANLFTAIIITHIIFDIFQERGWKFGFGQ
jgi:SecD/SecF fusion protein